MGRYISGDIDAKCWFGVQPSDFAVRFGVPAYYSFSFTIDDLESVETEMGVIKKHLKGYLKKLDKFFSTGKPYTYDELAKFLGVTEQKVAYLLHEYADYCRGLDIIKCLKEKGECNFEVEL